MLNWKFEFTMKGNLFKFFVFLTLELLFMVSTALSCDDYNPDIGFLRIGTYSKSYNNISIIALKLISKYFRRIR